MERFCVGLDVSAKTLDVAYRDRKRGTIKKIVCNDASGHRELVQLLKRVASGRVVRIVLESTGVYGFDVALALEGAGFEVMVANPRASSNFSKASMQRSKTDALDAVMLLQFAETMAFRQWHAPSTAQIEVRSIARRVHALMGMIREEKNRMHAANQMDGTDAIRKSIESTVKAIQKEVTKLRALALELIEADPQMAVRYELLLTVKGIGQISAIAILAELSVLPPDMTDRQWVAHAGLDPREFESGTSVHTVSRISKRGNKYLRSALYIPARVASRFDPGVASYAGRLRERGKRPLQIHVAVMRKLLHSVHAMFSSGEAFDSRRYYLVPAAGAEGTSGIASLAISEVSSAQPG